MTRKHWITKNEIKELYSLSDNKIALMRKLNLVTTKLGERKGSTRGRKPILYKKSMINALKDYTPIQLNEIKYLAEDTKQQFQKNDIEAVVEQECEDKYEYTYVQSVDHPSHYNKTELEVIVAIDAWDLDFSEGNIIKYLLRAKHKKVAKEDLEKCLWYIKRLIERC